LELIDRLSAIEPHRSGPPTVVHGDPKPGNTMWRSGRLAALLDWEMSYNGEPLDDLGYLLFFFEGPLHPAFLSCNLPGFWNREQIIAEWERLTGRSAAGLQWYEAAALAKLGAILAHGEHLVKSGQSDDERMGRVRPFIEFISGLLLRTIETMT
jgi:aminoglycoside phosphotransferase (APT) family kinase protein